MIGVQGGEMEAFARPGPPHDFGSGDPSCMQRQRQRQQEYGGAANPPSQSQSPPSCSSSGGPTDGTGTLSAIFLTASIRCFGTAELIYLLSPHTTPLTLSRLPPAGPPPSGSILLYNRSLTRNYKDDHHEWVKKKISSKHRSMKVREDDVKLCLDGKVRVAGYYARSARRGTMRRRAYYLLNPADMKRASDWVLVHYLDTGDLSGGAASSPSPSTSGSGSSEGAGIKGRNSTSGAGGVLRPIGNGNGKAAAHGSSPRQRQHHRQRQQIQMERGTGRGGAGGGGNSATPSTSPSAIDHVARRAAAWVDATKAQGPQVAEMRLEAVAKAAVASLKERGPRQVGVGDANTCGVRADLRGDAGLRDDVMHDLGLKRSQCLQQQPTEKAAAGINASQLPPPQLQLPGNKQPYSLDGGALELCNDVNTLRGVNEGISMHEQSHHDGGEEYHGIGNDELSGNNNVPPLGPDDVSMVGSNPMVAPAPVPQTGGYSGGGDATYNYNGFDPHAFAASATFFTNKQVEGVGGGGGIQQQQQQQQQQQGFLHKVQAHIVPARVSKLWMALSEFQASPKLDEDYVTREWAASTDVEKSEVIADIYGNAFLDDYNNDLPPSGDNAGGGGGATSAGKIDCGGPRKDCGGGGGVNGFSNELQSEIQGMKLYMMDEELAKIPLDDKFSFLEAQRHCPDLAASRDVKMQFLQCEGSCPKAAARRLVKYWSKKVQLFGRERAFLPLNLEGTMADDHEEPEFGHARLLPGLDTSGRAIIFMDNSIRGNIMTHIRSLWYMAHAALENECVQRNGFVIVLYKQPPAEALDMTEVVELQCLVRDILPQRLRAMHVCNFESMGWFMPLIHAVLRFTAGKYMRSRLIFHDGSTEHVLLQLAEFGISREQLPTQIGGNYTDAEFQQWLSLRRASGR